MVGKQMRVVLLGGMAPVGLLPSHLLLFWLRVVSPNRDLIIQSNVLSPSMSFIILPKRSVRIKLTMDFLISAQYMYTIPFHSIKSIATTFLNQAIKRRPLIISSNYLPPIKRHLVFFPILILWEKYKMALHLIRTRLKERLNERSSFRV